MKLISIFNCLIFILSFSSCYQNSVSQEQVTVNQKKELQGSDENLSVASHLDSSSQPVTSLSQVDPLEDEVYVPSYGRVDLGTCFNADCSKDASSTDPNFIFDLVSVDIYQPIYIDYKQESFPGWTNGSLAYFSDGEDITKRLTTSPEGVSATFTAWQPDKTLAEDAESILENSYYSLLGHYVKNFDVSGASGIDELWVTEGEGTAVIKLRTEAAEASDEVMWLSLAPPKEYNMVHYVSGGTYDDLAIKCQDPVYQSHSPGTFLCDKIYTAKYSGGSMDKDMGALSTELVSNFYKNLVIWEPVPEPGYRCLGYLTTNDIAQPSSTAYAAGQISSTFEGTYLQKYMKTFWGTFEALSEGWQDFPMLCINEKYLTRAKYGDVITWTTKTMTDGSEKRFLIVKVTPLESNDVGYNPESIGLGSTGLFVTIEDIEGGLTIEDQTAMCNGPTRTDACPLWVLDKKYVNIKSSE